MAVCKLELMLVPMTAMASLCLESFEKGKAGLCGPNKCVYRNVRDGPRQSRSFVYGLFFFSSKMSVDKGVRCLYKHLGDGYAGVLSGSALQYPSTKSQCCTDFDFYFNSLLHSSS